MAATFIFFAATVAIGASEPSPAGAATAPTAPVLGGTIRILADNDFALLAGNENNVTRMILQNDVVWMEQAANATTYQINLNSGESYIYLLAMGGGGGEDIGGLLNDVDITTIASGVNGIQRAVGRTDGTIQNGYLLINTFFPDWSSVGFSGNSSTNVEYGKYAPSISNIQTALTGSTWGDPPARQSGGVGGSVTGYGYSVPSSQAVMFRFKASSLGGGFVSAKDESAEVSWSVSTSDGGSPILDYSVTAYNASTNAVSGNICTTPNGATTTCTVTGLTNGVSYYFRITARNAIGSGPQSSATAPVTPNDFTPPVVTLASPSNTQSINNPVFTVTGNEKIDCTTLSSSAGADLTVVGGTINSIAQASPTQCSVKIATTVAAAFSTTVTVTRASTFSITDLAGNATTALAGSPASITVAIPAPTTTTTTSTTVAPKVTTTTAPVELEIVVRAPTEQTNTTVAQIGQSAIASVTTVPFSATTVARSSLTAKTSITTTSTSSTIVSVPSQSPAPPSVPALDSGGASVVSGGKALATNLTRKNNQIVILAGGMSATIDGLDALGKVVPLDGDGNVRMKGGARVRVVAEGFKPNSLLEAWLFSTPVRLGTGRVDAQGKFSKIFLLPANIEPGEHRLAIRAVTYSGEPATLALGILIANAKKERNIATWLIVTPMAFAIATAFFLPAAFRRRRETEETN